MEQQVLQVLQEPPAFKEVQDQMVQLEVQDHKEVQEPQAQQEL
jgi:hypothetical protein